MKVELFLSPVCPHCPAARKVFFSVAEKRPGDSFEEVNTYTEAGIERGMSLQVMAVPTVAVEGVIKIVGWPFDEGDLEKALEGAS
ncbi:MAG TPA: thioredoxin family protein [Candidatus Bathyarchaeia archaeon]